jgi:hypothetical protein
MHLLSLRAAFRARRRLDHAWSSSSLLDRSRRSLHTQRVPVMNAQTTVTLKNGQSYVFFGPIEKSRVELRGTLIDGRICILPRFAVESIEIR